MFFFTFLFLFFSGFLEFPSVWTSIHEQQHADSSFPLDISTPEPFTDVLSAFKKWDSQVACAQFREKYKNQSRSKSGSSVSGSLQEVVGGKCDGLKMEHVTVLVQGWTWIPDNLDNLYSCRCGLSCLWTKSSVLIDKPDALLFETTTPPLQLYLWKSKNGELQIMFN